MTKIEYGSIEIIRGVGNNSVSEGKAFGPDDNVDSDDIPGAVKRLFGATVESPRNNSHANERARAMWNGKDKNGKNATIIVWETERG